MKERVKEHELKPLNRPPDSNTERSMARERLAVTLEKLAAQVRADDGEKRYYAWSQEVSHLVINDGGHARSMDIPPNAEVTTIRVTWKRP